MRATLLLTVLAAAGLCACGRNRIYSSRSIPPPPAPAPGGSEAPAFVGRWAASRADCASRPWIVTRFGLDSPGRTHCVFVKLSAASAGYAADVACKALGPDEIGRITLTLSGRGASRGLTLAGGPFALPVALAPCPRGRLDR
jgi:hypothetical protein